MAAAPFSTHLMGGFDLLYERTEEVLKSTNEMGAYFKKLSEVENEYAKSLSKLNQATKKLFGTRTKKTEKEFGTLKDCWDGVQGETEGIANKHASFAGNLLNDVAQAITQYVKQKEQERKRLVDEGRRITKEYKDILAALKAAQVTYERKCKEAERAHAQHEKAKAEGSMKPKEIHKLSSAAAKSLEAATVADGEYQKMIQKGNAKQQKFHEMEMPQLLKDFQSFEEDRIRFLKTILGKFHSLVAELPPFLQTTEQSVSRYVTAINVDTDIKSYAESNRTNFAVPSDIRYEPYVPENPSFGVVLNASSPPPPQTSSSTSLSSSVPASQARATSTFTPSAPKADLSTKVWGLTDEDYHLSQDEKIRKLKEQLNEVKNGIRAETKSKKGLEKLVKFYTSDPVAQDKARGELEEQNRKIGLFREGRNKIQAQLAELGEHTAPDDTGDEDDGGAAGGSYAGGAGGYAAAAAAPSSGCRVRGLYDYPATNDTELSFREGDILNITERDDSGWWYAELNGVMGFIPSNYVELVD